MIVKKILFVENHQEVKKKESGLNNDRTDGIDAIARCPHRR